MVWKKRPEALSQWEKILSPSFFSKGRVIPTVRALLTFTIYLPQIGKQKLISCLRDGEHKENEENS
jgi:hypothetical protein